MHITKDTYIISGILGNINFFTCLHLTSLPSNFIRFLHCGETQQKLIIRVYLFSSQLVGDAFAGFSAISSVQVQHRYIINNVILWGLYVEADA